jgi:hypothetical protein
VATLTEANSRLAKQLEENATALKEIKALLKKERAECANSGNSEQPPRTVGTLNSHLAAISRLLLITIAGLTVTKQHLPTQAKLACTQRMGTNVKTPRQKTWEDPKSTGIDFWGRHLKIIAKYLMIFVPHPCLRTMKHPL